MFNETYDIKNYHLCSAMSSAIQFEQEAKRSTSFIANINEFISTKPIGLLSNIKFSINREYNNYGVTYWCDGEDVYPPHELSQDYNSLRSTF